jgi:TatD DNase family protein
MQLIDTHAHICFDSYDKDRPEMMSRAYDSGVFKIVHPCCSVSEIPTLLKLTEEYDGINKIDLYTALGVHPSEISTWDNNSANEIEQHLISNINNPNSKIKAIGETGLDYFHVKEIDEQNRQREIFREQIQLAKKYKLPLIVHTRDAWVDTLRILTEEYPADTNAHNGTIHCYTGDYNFASEVIKHGFYISWSGIVTYKKNGSFRETAKQIPIERVLIETDCPFLAPQVMRGKRNEPSYVNYIAETLAECYGISKEELAKISTQNAEKLFKI